MKLEPGEMICPKCNGKSHYQSWGNVANHFKPPCSKCLGTGKVDWIENITGKKLPISKIINGGPL